MGEILSVILKAVSVQWLMTTKDLNWFGKGVQFLLLVLIAIFALWFACWAVNDSIRVAVEWLAVFIAAP